MTARVLLFVQGPDDARPKKHATAKHRDFAPEGWPALKRTDWCVKGELALAASVAVQNGSRWWLVECENADAGRDCIAAHAALEHSHPEERPGHEDGALTLGRILASGVANKEVAR